jgi:hypothetical protein
MTISGIRSVRRSGRSGGGCSVGTEVVSHTGDFVDVYELLA